MKDKLPRPYLLGPPDVFVSDHESVPTSQLTDQEADESGVPVVEGEHGVEEVRDEPGPRAHRHLALLQGGHRVAHRHRHAARGQRPNHLALRERGSDKSLSFAVLTMNGSLQSGQKVYPTS